MLWHFKCEQIVKLCVVWPRVNTSICNKGVKMKLPFYFCNEIISSLQLSVPNARELSSNNIL